MLRNSILFFFLLFIALESNSQVFFLAVESFPLEKSSIEPTEATIPEIGFSITDISACQDSSLHDYRSLDKAKLPSVIRRFLRNLDKPLEELRPSIAAGSDIKPDSCIGLTFHERTYTIHCSMDSVWDSYTTVSPVQAWNSEFLEFGMVFDRGASLVYYDDSLGSPALGEDMILFVKLSVAHLINIPVAFEVTRIDPVNKVIEFTYLSDNITHGIQTLLFSEQDGITTISHSSAFSSGHRFRDKRLYPHFHEITLDDFHAGMFEMIRMADSSL